MCKSWRPWWSRNFGGTGHPKELAQAVGQEGKARSSSTLTLHKVLGWETIQLGVVRITVQKDPSEWM